MSEPYAGGPEAAVTTPTTTRKLAYAVTAGSPAIDTGLTIGGNGGVDYAGPPDIGALEYGATAG